MNKKILLFTTLIGLTFLVGCSRAEHKVPLEEIGLAGIMAFDYIDENKVQLSVAIPQHSPGAKASTQVFSVPTELLSKGIVDIEALSDKKILFNQLRVVLINEEFARKGRVERMIQHLYRNPEPGNKVLIAIVKGSSEELINADYPNKPDINYYINDLLLPTINTAFNPNTNIHDFIYTATNPVFDPLLPIIEKKDDKLEITGVALFKNNNMFETLTPEEAFIIQDLIGKKKLAPLSVELNQGHGKESLMLERVKSRVKMKSNKNIKSPKLTISLFYKGTLVEYTGERENDLHSPESLSKLEKDINKQVEEEVKKTLNKLKELKVDPIGLSENFRMYYDGKWTKEMTEENISKLEVDIQVKTSIISTGTLD
ncbi:spore gernimation protein [Lysinibacillus contaminans]|uniref:Spore gernimation protein n=1 Tax=Lysinibacillus contaminans TaxID=1293441 RepID=A0ABR5JZT2_9BACI|nr:Ger(x)C family spore germination protein [Lysinibacillus contaminans]KOS67962.1 spore gernimation protein [Lysinibacillus contaminans]